MSPVRLLGVPSPVLVPDLRCPSNGDDPTVLSLPVPLLERSWSSFSQDSSSHSLSRRVPSSPVGVSLPSPPYLKVLWIDLIYGS